MGMWELWQETLISAQRERRGRLAKQIRVDLRERRLRAGTGRAFSRVHRDPYRCGVASMEINWKTHRYVYLSQRSNSTSDGRFPYISIPTRYIFAATCTTPTVVAAQMARERTICHKGGVCTVIRKTMM